MPDEEVWIVEEDEAWKNLSEREQEEARELAKAIIAGEKEEKPSSSESRSEERHEKRKSEIMDLLEIQNQRIDQMAKLMVSVKEADEAEWQAARLVLEDQKEANALTEEYIEKLVNATEDLGLATAALVKIAQQLKPKQS